MSGPAIITGKFIGADDAVITHFSPDVPRTEKKSSTSISPNIRKSAFFWPFDRIMPTLLLRSPLPYHDIHRFRFRARGPAGEPFVRYWPLYTRLTSCRNHYSWTIWIKSYTIAETFLDILVFSHMLYKENTRLKKKRLTIHRWLYTFHVWSCKKTS